jgi:hypothetical protein
MSASFLPSNPAALSSADEDFLFLVWPDYIVHHVMSVGTTVSHPYFMFLGPRSQAMESRTMATCLTDSVRPHAIFTAEQLGFSNEEMQAYSADCDRFGYGRPLTWLIRPRTVLHTGRARIALMTETIKVRLAAWYRRRHALAAFAR